MNAASGQPRDYRTIRRALTLIAFVLALGYFFHTSHDRVILGKYNLRYTIFLGVVFFVVLPIFYFVVRFFSTTSQLKGSGERIYSIYPGQKLRWGALLALFGYIAMSWFISWFNSKNVATHDAHAFHPYLQNISRPNHEGQHVNHWGFKGDELEVEKLPKTFRVFVFGGSTVHCGTVPYENTHCRVLEKRLREAYPDYDIQVQNLGAEWHSTEHDVIKLLFLAQDFKPDLVVIFHGINDVVRSFETDMFGDGPYMPDYRHYYGAVSNLVQPSRTIWAGAAAFTGHWFSDYRFDQVRIAGPEGKGLNGMITMFFPKTTPVEIKEWKSLPAFERNLRDFVAIAQSKNIPVLLATQASLYRNDLTPREQEVLTFPLSHHFHGQRASLASMVDGMHRYNEVTRQIARETSVRFVDIEQKMPKTEQYLYDDVHYTADGNALIGNAFADDIVQWGLVPDTIADRHRTSDQASTQP